jgi:hypothetical protein
LWRWRTFFRMESGLPEQVASTIEAREAPIDGRWRDSAEHRDSINPATGEVIGRYARAGEDEAREATAAALRTFR